MVREVRSGRDAQTAPGTAAPAAAIGPVRQARAVRHHHRIVWFLLGLKAAGQVLRSRRTHELMIVSAIMLAALTHQARENQAQILARLIAWEADPAPSAPGHARPAQDPAGSGA